MKRRYLRWSGWIGISNKRPSGLSCKTSRPVRSCSSPLPCPPSWSVDRSRTHLVDLDWTLVSSTGLSLLTRTGVRETLVLHLPPFRLPVFRSVFGLRLQTPATRLGWIEGPPVLARSTWASVQTESLPRAPFDISLGLLWPLPSFSDTSVNTHRPVHLPNPWAPMGAFLLRPMVSAPAERVVLLIDLLVLVAHYGWLERAEAGAIWHLSGASSTSSKPPVPIWSSKPASCPWPDDRVASGRLIDLNSFLPLSVVALSSSFRKVAAFLKSPKNFASHSRRLLFVVFHSAWPSRHTAISTFLSKVAGSAAVSSLHICSRLTQAAPRGPIMAAIASCRDDNAPSAIFFVFWHSAPTSPQNHCRFFTAAVLAFWEPGLPASGLSCALCPVLCQPVVLSNSLGQPASARNPPPHSLGGRIADNHHRWPSQS